MSLHVCAEPGCPKLTTNTRCAIHYKDRRKQQDKHRPGARARGYDEAWSKTRAAYLTVYPICQHEDGCLNEATDVDHIDGQGPTGPNGHDWSNLRGLCHAHHSQRTARDQPAGWNA